MTFCLGVALLDISRPVATLGFAFGRKCSSSVDTKHCQLLVIGSGSGGVSTAARLSKKLKTVVVDPADFHYYQPLWTLVGGGLKTLEETRKTMSTVMPKNVEWIKDSAELFEPERNTVTTKSGVNIKYDFLVVATGIKPDFSKIPGLEEALKTGSVGSNYTAETVGSTFTALKNFREGNAIFTFPTTPIKCPGAPQKIAYLTDAYLRQTGKRDKANIIFNSSLGVIFGVKKYADALTEVAKAKGVQVNLKHNLIEVIPDRKQAVFKKLDCDSIVTFDYEMMHVTPPMYPIKEVARSSLADPSGYVDVNKLTLQSIKYDNVFAIGDCTNVPTSRTAAAVAGQLGVLSHNLMAKVNGEPLTAEYDGYTSCPLTTGFNKCILAEFDFNAQPLETFPFDQSKERKSMYLMKRDIIPQIYWSLFVNGKWTGPKVARKVLSFGRK